MGGENAELGFQKVGGSGSSPRGRGKRRRCPSVLRQVGLIPAWAGKTATSGEFVERVKAHPRVGGENSRVTGPASGRAGSSPRGRGKRRTEGRRRPRRRLIPAWAGKTSRDSSTESVRWAHPRVGGENSAYQDMPGEHRGSSPRGRGKPRRGEVVTRQRGLIPAWAGKTRRRSRAIARLGAHPRVGGENGTPSGRASLPLGSSPRGRGKRVTFLRR